MWQAETHYQTIGYKVAECIDRRDTLPDPVHCSRSTSTWLLLQYSHTTQEDQRGFVASFLSFRSHGRRHDYYLKDRSPQRSHQPLPPSLRNALAEPAIKF